MLLIRKNEIVAEISLDTNGNINAVHTIFNSDLLPVGVLPKLHEPENREKNSEKELSLLNNWWRNHMIPVERDSIRLGLECIGIKTQEELKLLSHGLSLTNHYWIKDEKEDNTWEDVNFWDNAFSKEVGTALFNHKPVHKNVNIAYVSPDASLNGALKKKWIILDGEYYIQKSGLGLNKEEVFNEVLTSEVMNFAQIPNAGYQLYPEDGEVSCIAKCFTDKNTELIPLCQVMESVPRKVTFPFQTELEHLYDIFEYYQVKNYKKYMNDLLCIDYIFAGTCMWANKPTKTIEPLDDKILARLICNKNTFGTWEEQKKYITDYIYLPKGKLFLALENYVKKTRKYSEMSVDRIRMIATGCVKRANQLQKYLMSEKGVRIAEDMLMTEDDVKIFEDFDF